MPRKGQTDRSDRQEDNVTIDITETVGTLKHVQRLKRSIPVEWTQQNKKLGPRALDALRVVEQAESEGRDVFTKDIAVALGVKMAQARKLVIRLRQFRRLTIKHVVGRAEALTTMMTAEDLEYPYNLTTPEEREAYRCRIAFEKQQKQERIREQKKREAEARLWVWNPHGWIYLPDWKARYDFPNGGPA